MAAIIHSWLASYLLSDADFNLMVFSNYSYFAHLSVIHCKDEKEIGRRELSQISNAGSTK